MNVISLFLSACTPIMKKEDDMYHPMLANNILILSLCLISAPYAIIFYFISKILGVLVGIILVLYFYSFKLSKKGYYRLSRILFITVASASMWLYASSFGQYVGIQSLIFLFLPATSVICYRREKMLKKLLSAIVFLFFVILIIFDFNNGIVSIYTTDSFRYFLYPINTVAVTAMIYILVYNISTSQQKEIEISRKLSGSLLEKNNSLEEANKKLKETAQQEVFLKMGREIQAQFLPEVPKELKICNSTYHFETMYKPSNEVSGDLYDFYVQNNKIKVFHSDVIGKNVPAMMVALNIHSELKHLLKQGDEEPQTLMNELNKNIYDMRAKMSGCAGVYYEIDTEAKKLTYVHMGYEDIYLIRGKECIDIGSEGGPQLGNFENISYKQTSIAFKEGDMLLTISDGMSDMKNEAGKRYSQDVGVKTYITRYIESAGSKTTETLKEWLETEINRYTGNTDVYADDISVFITSLDIS